MSASSGPQPLGKLLADLTALRGIARVGGANQLAQIWSQVAGPDIAGETRPLGIKRGVLTVGVANAPLLGELVSFHRQLLLESLKREHPDLKIRDVRFRLKGEMGG